MKFSRFWKYSVGSKIALVTSGALIFVTAVFVLIFFILDIELFSKFTLIQLIGVFVGLLLFVEIVLIVLSTNIFVQRPLQKLGDVMRIAEGGNFFIRTDFESHDEFNDFAQSFNRTMAKITDLDARKIETERELFVAQENLKIKNELGEKAKIIEETNEKLELSLRELSVLYHISQSLSHTLELDELLATVSRSLTKTLKLKEFVLLFLDETKKFLEVREYQGFADNSKISGMKFKLGEGICGRAAKEKKMIYVEDTSHNPDYLYYKGEKEGEGSFISIPLIVREKVIGVLNVGDPKKGAFSTSDIQLFESIANQIAVAADRSQLYMKTKELSVKDELTGLYNRRYFQSTLEMEWKRASRFSRSLALLMIDADNFKKYNDTYGHPQGDQALKHLARILILNIREVDTVSRFGGEEFVILLVDTSFDDAFKLAETLRSLVEQNTPLFHPQVAAGKPLTVSIGVSSFPEKVSTVEELMGSADMALYKAKNLGRNRVVGFSKSLDSGRGGREKASQKGPRLVRS